MSPNEQAGAAASRLNVEADVVVVGAGVAGCAAAATALEAGRSVLVFEAGPSNLPPALRSADLNRASGAAEWWWPGPYLSGRGVGGGSAVNGMVVQRPLEPDAATHWAWDALNPVPVEPGPLGRRLMAAAGTHIEPEMTAAATTLAVRDGQRRTAADTWLGPHPDLTVVADAPVSAEQVRSWVGTGRTVLVAAGALRSPGLVGLEGHRVRDHASAVVGFEVPVDLRVVPTTTMVATVLLRCGDAQLLVLERAGADPKRGAVIVSAMVEDPAGLVLGDGVEAATILLATIGLDAEVMPEPAPVAHACCTLTGLDTLAPVVDASTLPALPSVNPMLTVAAHARRETLRLLH